MHYGPGRPKDIMKVAQGLAKAAFNFCEMPDDEINDLNYQISLIRTALYVWPTIFSGYDEHVEGSADYVVLEYLEREMNELEKRLAEGG